MRYLFIFLLFFSANLFAQEPPPKPICAGVIFSSCSSPQLENLSSQCAGAPSANKFLDGPGEQCAKVGDIIFYKFICRASCTCPEGSTWYTGYDQQGNPTSGCSPNTDGSGGEGDQCVSPQVMYEGFCRDGVGSPGDCGSTYTTAVKVGDLYACSNNGCSAGQNQSVFTNPSGSWNVCGDGDGDGEGSASSGSNTSTGGDSSTGTNSSGPSSTGSGGDSSSGSGPGTGGGSGDGSGTGTGNGSGASSSSPTNPGSGSASSGIGLGGEADASNCENGEPHCDGDPIQCAILVQLWINACAGYDQEQTNNPDDDNDAIEASFVSLISSAEPSVNAEGVLTAMTPGGGNGNGTGSGSGPGTGSGNGGGGSGIDLSGLDGAANSGAGGTCPPDRSISLGAGNFNVSYQFFCDFASQVSGLVILIFSYIGGMIVYRSLNW